MRAISVSPNQIAFDFSVTDLPQSAPFRKGSATSKKAADKLNPHLSKLHKLIVETLCKYPHSTPDRVAEITGAYFITVRARCTDLKNTGFVYASGEGFSNQMNAMDKLTLTAKGYQLAKQLNEKGAG